MKVFTHLEQLSEIKKPVFLTIGNFDGVHLGHETILKNLVEGAAAEQISSLVITFSNHPSEILRPNHPIPLLTSKEQKLKLLKNLGIDTVLMIEFTLPFSSQSAEAFLRSIYHACPFRRLILGSDAKIGNDHQGNTPLLHKIAQDLHFALSFLPLELHSNQPITSSRIRLAIQNAELTEAEKLLGRKFSLLQKGYTSSLKGLCHPPPGVYAVTLIHQHTPYQGTAHLSISQNDRIPLLEVKTLNPNLNLSDQTVEVIFEEFLRPER